MSKEPRRNVYVGHRYVPKIMGEWNKEQTYEGLSIVTHQGNSYTSKKHVPVGIDILDEEYWVVTGNYNAQIEHYRQEVRNMGDYVDSEVNNLTNYVNSEVNNLTNYVNSELESKANQVDLDETNQRLAEIGTQLEGLEVNVTTVGVYPDDEVDHTETLRQLIATGAIPVFPAGRYIISDELLFNHGQAIRTVGKVIFDGTNFVGTNGNSIIKVTNKGENYSELPPLTHDIVLGTNELNFSAPHGLQVGDIICLYDNTEYSWSSARRYYKKGEFCRVSSIISDTKVLLDNSVFDEYNATTNSNFGVYKMNMGSFNIYGNLEVIQGKKGNYYGIVIERVKDFNAENIVSYAKNGSYAAIQLNQCYNASLKGVAIQESLSGLGGDYGLSIANCQHVRAEGYFSASRHGVTHGGFDGVGAIITRDSTIKGTVKTNELGSVPAFDCHGNTEYISFSGVIYGGANIGGENNSIKGTIFSLKSTGFCIYMAEVKSFSHDFSGVKMISNENPAEILRGVFDFGGNIINAEVDYAKGGTLKLTGAEIIAPNSERGVVIRTRNTNFEEGEYVDIDLSGLKMKLKTTADSDSVGIVINNFNGSGRSFRLLNLTNTVIECNRVAINNVDKTIGEYTNLYTDINE